MAAAPLLPSYDRSARSPEQVARDAICYLLRRIQCDPDARWLMGRGTASLEQLCLAYAALTGMSAEEVERAVLAVQPVGEALVEKLGRRLRELEGA